MITISAIYLKKRKNKQKNKKLKCTSELSPNAGK